MVLSAGSSDIDRVNERTSVLILGGGRGTRLYPLTKERSKPAVPVAGKFRLIDLTISNCIHSHLYQISILTQFNSDSLHRHISMTYRFDLFSRGYVQILAAQQTPENMNWYQGTADAVRQSLRRFERRTPDNMLILSGDHLYKMDYRKLLKTHVDKDADATIAVVPVSQKACADFGILQVDEKAKIVSFVEKPQDEETLNRLRVPPALFDDQGIESQGRDYIASMGIYVFKFEALREALHNSGKPDFGKDIIPYLIQNQRVYAHFFDGYWEDIGTISAFYEANLALTDPVPNFNFYDERCMVYTHPRFLAGAKINNATVRHSIICDGTIISGALIDHSIVGLRGIIAEKAQVVQTVLMGADYYDHIEQRIEDIPSDAPPLGIGPRSVVQGAIIDKNARIGADVQIVNKDNVQEADGENYCIRDGIVVIPRSTIIPDGTVI